MLQILSNLFLIYMFPFLAGLVLRFAVRKTRKPFLWTICLMAFAALMWGIAMLIPNDGNEAHGLQAVMASCLAIGALIAGLVTRIRR